MPDATDTERVNISISQMMNRMIHTSLTTLFVMVVLVVLGVTSIREFGIPIIVGLLAGTYSSICIAGPLWTVLNGWGASIKNKRKYKAKKAEK